MKVSLALPLIQLVGLVASAPVAAPKRALGERETPLNSLLAAILDNLPQVDGTIDAVAGILTDFEQVVADVTGIQTTYNQLGGACKPYTVIFARGTTEPGNVGVLVGPPFFDALTSLVGASSVTIQGVNNYAATVSGYLEGGDPNGSANMASQIKSALSSCPNTKLIVAGYSQGGQIVHNAISQLPAATASAISKVVIFGDPDESTAVANVDSSKILIVCHSGDNICVNGDLILVPHLTYGANAEQAASFVVG
ncbi:putative cutinase precursor [Xylogone sp. PMI_703]|nr:putative cutinase precursor [Xylogone sp. PMI_703]